VNSHAEYRRHSYRPPEPAAAVQGNDALINELAHHRDPSLTAGGKSPTPTAKGIAWVRPTDLATYAAPVVGRGIDLQAELIRRARRTPATTTRALQRGIQHSPRPAAPVNHTEGLSL
jgi:hypothetical protein